MEYVKKHRSGFILLAVGLMMFMVNLDFTAVNLALAPIARDFHATMSQLQWVGNGFVIVSASLMAIAGRLSDIFGKKRLFIIGGAIFVIASGVAGIAPNEMTLVLGRCLQGIGFAIVFPVCMMIAFTAVPENKRGFAIGFINGMAGLAQAVGPSFGGVLVQFLTWRWIFFVNIPIGLLSILLTYLICKKDVLKRQKEVLDYPGSILLFIPLFLLMYVLNEFSSIGVSGTLFAFLIFVVFSFVLFIWWEKKTRYPLIDFRLFKTKVFIAINIIRLVINLVFFAFLFIIGLYLQNILSYSALQAGLLLLFLTCVYGALSPIAGKWIDKIGYILPLVVGFLCAILAFGFFAWHPVITSWTVCIIPFALIGTSFGILIPCAAMVALNSVPEEKMGSAAGIFYTNASIGGALGIALTGTLVSMVSVHKVSHFVASMPWTFNQVQTKLLQHAVTGTISLHQLQHAFSPVVVKMLSKEIVNAFASGFSVIMGICFGLSIISLFLVMFIRKKRRGGSHVG